FHDGHLDRRAEGGPARRDVYLRGHRLFRHLLCGLDSGPPSQRGHAAMIRIDNVSKWFGPMQVLADCSTSVDRGEVVVVCGPSGSGKSTLLKCINGLERVQKG